VAGEMKRPAIFPLRRVVAHHSGAGAVAPHLRGRAPKRPRLGIDAWFTSMTGRPLIADPCAVQPGLPGALVSRQVAVGGD